MKNNARFHDPHGSSLHSHTQSSSAFLSWSSSSSNPSLSRPTTPPDHKHHHHPQTHYDEALAFTVRASLADGEEEGDIGQVHVREEEGEGEGKVRYRESRVEGLVTPPVDKAGKRIRYCVLEVSAEQGRGTWRSGVHVELTLSAVTADGPTVLSFDRLVQRLRVR